MIKKKLVTIVLGIGVGLGSIGVASAGGDPVQCQVDLDRCIANGHPAMICQSIYQMCLEPGSI